MKLRLPSPHQNYNFADILKSRSLARAPEKNLNGHGSILQILHDKLLNSRLNAKKRLGFLWFIIHKFFFNNVQYKKIKLFLWPLIGFSAYISSTKFLFYSDCRGMVSNWKKRLCNSFLQIWFDCLLFGLYHGLQTPNEGINQRYLKNLGLGLNLRPCCEGYFLSGRP